MYLLLDECCPKSLVAVAADLGHTAQRTVEIAGLGRQASDAAIFAYACAVRGIVVTVNAGDFLVLARRSPNHPGLILLPALTPTATGRLFRRALAAADRVLAISGSVLRGGFPGRAKQVSPKWSLVRRRKPAIR